MELTGKCREDFENWYRKTFCAYGASIGSPMSLGMEYENDIDFEDKYAFFNNAPFSMQYGVYVDFFDSVGIVIGLNSTFGFAGRQIFRLYVGNDKHQSKQDNPSSRTEARIKAVYKANEIYNSKL